MTRALVVASDGCTGNELSDHELVAGLARRDARAFDRVYRRLRGPPYSFLVRLSGRSDLAEDLLQETWLRLARAAPELPEGTPLRPWLFTVARNVFCSHRRWSLLDGARLRSLAEALRVSAPAPFESSAPGGAERALERALGELHVEQREVLLLCGPRGFAPTEVARMLAITPEALRQRLSRARAKLRRCLEREEQRGTVGSIALVGLGLTFVAWTFHDAMLLFCS